MKHIEHVVLRTLIDHPEAWDYRPAADMFTGYSREVFEVMRGLKERGAGLDVIAVAEACGEELQDECQNLLTTASMASSMAGNLRVLRDEQRQREARTIGANLMETGDPDAARVALDELDGAFSTSDTVGGAEAKSELWADLSRLAEKEVTGLQTGLRDLDAILGGIEDGDFVIVAGRPSMGKTTLMLNIAAHQTEPVAIFSLETTVPKLMRRLLAGKGMDFGKLKRPRTMSARDWELAQTLTQQISDKLYVNNTGAMGISALESEARRLVRHKGVKLVAVDYLQLVTCKAERRFEEVSLVSRRLQALAKSLKVPVIAVSQLNRGPEAQMAPRPKLSDLRESGQLEQDADVVILVNRPDYYQSEHRPGEADLIVAKNKDGETGDVTVLWQGRYQRFVTMAKRWGQEVVA